MKQSKLLFLLFFIFIFSLTFSSNENKNKKQNLQQNNNLLDLHRENTLDKFLNCVQTNTDILKNSNTQNFKTNTNSDLYKTKKEENSKPLFDFLKTQETENLNIFSCLSKTHIQKESSIAFGKLLNINPDLIRLIFSFLSFFELEFNFKYASTKLHHLYEKFSQEEKHLLSEERLKNKAQFENNKKCMTIYFDFFEKRFWSEPNRIEYANVDSFSKNLVLFPKSIRQIITFQSVNRIEYKYVLFKNGHILILKKLTEEEKFSFTSFENEFTDFESLVNFGDKKQQLKIPENVRFIDLDDWSTPQNFKVRVILHTTDNCLQDIWHDESYQKIIICKPSYYKWKIVFLKNISGCLILEDGGLVKAQRVEKQINGKYKTSEPGPFREDVKKIESKDFENYARDARFIFNN